MDLEADIRQFLLQNLPSLDHFLVDVSVKTLGKEKMKIAVLVDSDLGITIDDCGVLSKKIGKWLEENNRVSSAYTLEVSSPGVDYPLESGRSFKKNVGRTLLVITQELQRVEGKLLEVNESSIRIQPLIISKKKTEEPEPIDIQLDKIKKATVQIVF